MTTPACALIHVDEAAFTCHLPRGHKGEHTGHPMNQWRTWKVPAPEDTLVNPRLPVASTGHCTTTHNACDCVLRRLKSLEDIVAEVRILKKDNPVNGISFLRPLMTALDVFDKTWEAK